MPYIINSKSNLPTIDDLMKPLAYLRDREDKFEQQWAESDAKASMYKHYIDNIRQTSPDHSLVKSYDSIQNELNSISDNLVGSAIDPNFNKRLYKAISMFNQFALPFEEAKQRYQKYNEIAAQMDPDFIFDSKSNPANLGIHSFYDNPNLVAPKGIKGKALYQMGSDIFGPIAQGVTNVSTKNMGPIMKIISKEGFTQPVIDKIIEAVTLNDPTLIDKIPGINKEVGDLLKYGVNASQTALSTLGITPDDVNYRNAAMNWLKQGIAAGSIQQIKQNIQGNPGYRTPIQIAQEQEALNQYAMSSSNFASSIDEYNKLYPKNQVNKNKSGYIDESTTPYTNITNFTNWMRRISGQSDGNNNTNRDPLINNNTDALDSSRPAPNITYTDRYGNKQKTIELPRDVMDPTQTGKKFYEYNISGGNLILTRFDSFYNKQITQENLKNLQDNILKRYGNIIKAGEDHRTFNNVWYAHSRGDGKMVLKQQLPINTRENSVTNSHRFIPLYPKNQYPTVQVKDASGKYTSTKQLMDGEFGLTDNKTPYTFDYQNIYIIDDSQMNTLLKGNNLPELTNEEKQTYTYVAIPKNLPDGRIGDAYNINRPSEYLILKVDKGLTQFKQEK